MADILNQVFTGLSIASILLLVSLGLAIIYGTMGVINLAHGEFVMLGAYAVWFLQKVFGLDLLFCVVFAFFMVGAVGWLNSCTGIFELVFPRWRRRCLLRSSQG